MNSQVVLRYRDGRTERVTLIEVDQEQEVFRVTREGGTNADVPFGEIKAVFYPNMQQEAPLEEAAGSSISVEFADGEVIRGMAQYNPERNGFFLFPNDRSKNERIFVVNSAIVSIEVERL